MPQPAPISPEAADATARVLGRVSPSDAPRPLRIMHIALQGALRWHDVEYGRTVDTGGHIKYVLELVEALSRSPRVASLDLVTRAFEADGFDDEYAETLRSVAPKVRIVRLRGASLDYVAKEEMWLEHEALTASLRGHVARFGTPDLVHAHYADAGALAAELKASHGVPYLFTGHSLGAVKRKAYEQSGRANPDVGLDRRIAIENAALKSAGLVIASSRDEAELQYDDYDDYDPGRARIVPPGIDREPFRARGDRGMGDRAVAAELFGRFLTDLDRPAILAVARPVSKKNLAGLVRAYGEHPTLRERANLVILAGNRTVLGNSECDRNIRELLELIDRYDLHGSVAYPKAHRVDQVPAVYRYAAATGGVFANPALNEPFGLTLLEAASVGLPVVATSRGGPNDIVGRLQNGTLVAPDDEPALGRALDALLTDREAWKRASANGLSRACDYEWDAHAARYLDLARAVVDRRSPTSKRPAKPRTLLATDIDGTLIGCPDSLERFAEWREERPDMLYAVATGRSLHAALNVLEHAGAPLPPLMIVAVGSEIYHRDPTGPGYTLDTDWAAHIAEGWDRQATDDVAIATPGLRRQSTLEQRAWKLSYFVDTSRGEAHAAECVAHLRERLADAGLRANIVHSHGEYVDVLPPRANKGLAVAFTARKLGIAEGDVFVSGDSGNDIDMLGRAANPVIVANHRDGIVSLPHLSHAYVAEASHAGGIMEGVEHFEARSTAEPSPAPSQ